MWKALIIISNLPLFLNPRFLLKLKKLTPWLTSTTRIEIEVMTNCTLACFNCNRSVRQAPSNEYMSLEQIEKFVTESIEQNWRWELINLIGGEPTLHPQLSEILKKIGEYKNFNPNCNIEISTNGYGKKVNEILSGLPDWVTVRNSQKTSNINDFSSYNIAPIDRKEYESADFSKGCWITEFCGMGLTRYGYYACGAGASADRVFGFNIGLRKLPSINDSTLKNQLRVLCMYCGNYKEVYGGEMINEEQISASWQMAYKKYKEKKPDIPLY